METTAFAYGDDWEKALAMEVGEAHEIRYLDCYHPGDHRIIGGRMACILASNNASSLSR
jgi:hypothetical protein